MLLVAALHDVEVVLVDGGAEQAGQQHLPQRRHLHLARQLHGGGHRGDHLQLRARLLSQSEVSIEDLRTCGPIPAHLELPVRLLPDPGGHLPHQRPPHQLQLGLVADVQREHVCQLGQRRLLGGVGRGQWELEGLNSNIDTAMITQYLATVHRAY